MQIRYLPTETSLWFLSCGMSLFTADFATNRAVYRGIVFAKLLHRFTDFAVVGLSR